MPLAVAVLVLVVAMGVRLLLLNHHHLLLFFLLLFLAHQGRGRSVVVVVVVVVGRVLRVLRQRDGDWERRRAGVGGPVNLLGAFAHLCDKFLNHFPYLLHVCSHACFH